MLLLQAHKAFSACKDIKFRSTSCSRPESKMRRQAVWSERKLPALNGARRLYQAKAVLRLL